jgi:MFS family permease
VLTYIQQRYTQAIFGTLFNLHLLEIGILDHIGTLQSLSALLIAAIAIPTGLAGDRWGRRCLYVTGSILFSVPYLIMLADRLPASPRLLHSGHGGQCAHVR